MLKIKDKEKTLTGSKRKIVHHLQGDPNKTGNLFLSRKKMEARRQWDYSKLNISKQSDF